MTLSEKITYTKIKKLNANNIQLVGGKEEKAEPTRQPAPQPASKQIFGPEGYESDEIPF